MDRIAPQQLRISIESALADAPVEWVRGLSAASPARRLTAAEALAAYLVGRVERVGSTRDAPSMQPALFHDDLSSLG